MDTSKILGFQSLPFFYVQDGQLVPEVPAQIPGLEYPAKARKSILENLPPGCKFRPDDIELVVHYLRNKVENESLLHEEYEQLVLPVKLYDHHPKDLIKMHEEWAVRDGEWYFFTHRDLKYPNGHRPRRSVAGKGYWKPTGKDVRVFRGGGIVGFKKELDFYKGKQPNGHRTKYKMHEYVIRQEANLHNKTKNSIKLDKWVLCKIYKRKRDTKNKDDKPEERPDHDHHENKNTSQNQIESTSGSSSYVPEPEPEPNSSLDDASFEDNTNLAFSNTSEGIPVYKFEEMLLQIPNPQVLGNQVFGSSMLQNYEDGALSLRGEAADNYFKSLPVGIKFSPSDEELILHYLKNKILNLPMHTNRIREVQLYNYHPSQLSKMYELIRESEWYFFTPRDKKYLNGIRPNRATANKTGYWKASGADAIIRVGAEEIGRKKTLVYYEGTAADNNGKKTNWIMHEFRIDSSNGHTSHSQTNPINPMLLDKWVLCRIYHRSSSAAAAKSINEREQCIHTTDHDQTVENKSENMVSCRDQNPVLAAPPYDQYQHPTSFHYVAQDFAPASCGLPFNHFVCPSEIYPDGSVGEAMDFFSSGPGGPSGQMGSTNGVPVPQHVGGMDLGQYAMDYSYRHGGSSGQMGSTADGVSNHVGGLGFGQFQIGGPMSFEEFVFR